VAFSHEALLYDGPDDLASRVVPFIEEGLDAGEPTMVALRVAAIEELCERLGPRASSVWFVDMAQLGRNPGRIIPAWHEFLAEHGGGERPVRGVGEPIWAGREADELVECQLHEALLNVAFADAESFRLLCPYDTRGLPESVIREACAGHPHIAADGELRDSDLYRGEDDLLRPFDAPLPAPEGPMEVLAYDRHSLTELRAMVSARARRSGVTPRRTEDLVFAVNELATNSVRHGGGNGVLRIWAHDGALVCEIRDRGVVADPLMGRSRPDEFAEGGWGVYLAHQLCDLVQVRSDQDGTVARVHMRRS
jgi:anti-sigma regulatory factor (Ser/Thr protein kinase)